MIIRDHFFAPQIKELFIDLANVAESWAKGSYDTKLSNRNFTTPATISNTLSLLLPMQDCLLANFTRGRLRFCILFGKMLNLCTVLCICLCLVSVRAAPEKNLAGSRKLSDKEHFDKDGKHNTEYDHEAFLGKEKKSFDQLTPEESIERLG